MCDISSTSPQHDFLGTLDIGQQPVDDINKFHLTSAYSDLNDEDIIKNTFDNSDSNYSEDTHQMITDEQINCQHCGIKYESSWILNLHHDDINYCKTCNLTFVSKNERALHIDKEHADYFRCLCGKICEENDVKKLHKKYCTRNYCYKCRVRLDCSDKYEEHVMNNHISDSECPFCEYKFSNINKVMSHYQLHTSIRPIFKQ